MGVDVDGLDALAVDDYLAAPVRVRLSGRAAARTRGRAGGDVASDKGNAGRQISADRHFHPRDR
jgi:hypothetical protein